MYTVIEFPLLGCTVLDFDFLLQIIYSGIYTLKNVLNTYCVPSPELGLKSNGDRDSHLQGTCCA